MYISFYGEDPIISENLSKLEKAIFNDFKNSQKI